MFNELVTFLIPLLSLQGEREALLYQAFHGDDAVLGKINYAGSAREFVPRLIRVLQHHGETSPGTQALWQLLLILKEQVGLEQQQDIDTFRAWANSPHQVTLQPHDVAEGLTTQINYNAPISGQNVVVGGNQYVQGTSRLVLFLFVLILAAVVGVAALTLIPSPQQAAILATLGIATLTPSPTQTLTPSPTFTPSPTPTLSPTPSLESYDVGLAVAYFAIPDDGSVSAEEADTLVEQVYARMQDDLNEFGSTVDLTVGYISPSTIGRIQGTTPLKRAESAADIARRYGADMVVYGQIKIGRNNRLEVQPEFYIRPEKFAEALEITGAYRLGSEIEVSGPLSLIRNAMSVNRPLSTRTTAAAKIFTGLTYYLLEDYESAYQTFEDVMDLPDWDEIDGKEVLYVLLGNTQQKLASTASQQEDLETALTHIDQALEWFAKAIEVAPEYARSYNGTASTLYIKWNVQARLTGASDLSLLQEVLTTLDKASKALDQPNEISIEAKELLIRAQADYWFYRLHRQDMTEDEATALYDEFDALTMQIIRRYENGRYPTLQELTSETYALVGNRARDDQDYEAAIEAFEMAIDLSFSAQRQMFFYGWIAQSYALLGQNEHASEAYAEAIALADETEGFEAQKAQYIKEREALNNGRG